MSVPDPNSEIDESNIDARTKKRSEIASTMARNGFLDTLVLSRQRASSLSDSHLAVIRVLEEEGGSSYKEIRESSIRLDGEYQRFQVTLEDTIEDLNKMGITTMEGDQVTLQHSHVVISLI